MCIAIREDDIYAPSRRPPIATHMMRRAFVAPAHVSASFALEDIPSMRPGAEEAPEKPPYPSVRVLRGLHCGTAALHLLWVSLAASCLTSKDVTVPVWTQTITYGANGEYSQLGQSRLVFNFRPLVVLIAMIAVTAAAHMFYACFRSAGARGNMWRWCEYSITATMLTLTAAVGVGASSIDAFAFVLVISVIMQATGLGLDLIHGTGRTIMRELLLFIGFVCVTSIVAVLAQHAQTAIGIRANQSRIAVAYGVFYTSFGIVGALRAYDVGMLRDDAFTELVYAILSVSCKTSMFWMSFGGIRQTMEDVPGEPHNGVNWGVVQNVAAGLPGPLAALALVIAFLAAPPPQIR